MRIVSRDAEADEPQKTEADEQEDADDLKESLRDYYPEHGFVHIGKKRSLQFFNTCNCDSSCRLLDSVSEFQR